MADNNDIFSADQVEVPVDIGLNDLVGEGQKYKTPDELAKAYANIEAHAKRIERENAEIRAKLDIAESKTPNSENTGREQVPNGDSQNEPPKQAPAAPKEEDFRSQIRDEVKALNEAERATANIEAAAARMVEVYGDTAKANEAVQNRAKELGVSVEWLRDSASRSPSAFYATMGIAQGASHTTPGSHSQVRIPTDSNVKNFEYFDKIRRENPKVYFSADTQKEMMAQARALGSDFYKR